METQTQNQYETTGYALSSWNYGSFHHCNPYYQKREYIKENNNQPNEKSHSASLNQFGKRNLPEEEKIVTEGYLQMMKEFKAIKNCDTGSKLKRNKSSAQIRKNEYNNENYDTSQNYLMETSQNNVSNPNSNSENFQQRSIKSSKSFKFQLNFEEWAAVKAKQQEIYKKVKIIKESEDQNFEYFNKKVDDNYKVIQEQNFNEWLQKKQMTKQMAEQRKKHKEEEKEMKKSLKQNENSTRLEEWFKRQAQMIEYQALQKKKAEEKKKAIEKKKKMEEDERKARANEAYKLWMRKKEDEKNIEKRNTQTDTKKMMKKTTLSRTKVVIGPYSNAKDLKAMQKKLTMFKNSGMYSNKSDNEEEKENYVKDEIEDSLQELSSIKKDSPVQDQEGDYY